MRHEVELRLRITLRDGKIPLCGLISIFFLSLFFESGITPEVRIACYDLPGFYEVLVASYHFGGTAMKGGGQMPK
jgi:hypothetical protein